jgi:hypothetical protein
MDTVSMGTAGLAGWRKKVADVVAPAVAQRTPLKEEQVRALVGGLFFVLAAMYVAKTARTALGQARS